MRCRVEEEIIHSTRDGESLLSMSSLLTAAFIVAPLLCCRRLASICRSEAGIFVLLLSCCECLLNEVERLMGVCRLKCCCILFDWSIFYVSHHEVGLLGFLCVLY